MGLALPGSSARLLRFAIEPDLAPCVIVCRKAPGAPVGYRSTANGALQVAASQESQEGLPIPPRQRWALTSTAQVPGA